MGLLAEFMILIFFITHSHVHSYPSEKNLLQQSNFAMEPSIFAGRMLTKWSETEHLGNPEEQGPYFEGDIITSNGRASFNRPARKWNNGIIPYEISESFSKSRLYILIF